MSDGRVYVVWDGTHFEDEMTKSEVRRISPRTKRNPAPAIYAGAGGAGATAVWANPRKKRTPPRKKNGQFRRKR